MNRRNRFDYSVNEWFRRYTDALMNRLTDLRQRFCLGALVLGVLVMPAALNAGEHLSDGCVVGVSERAHGLSDTEAVEQMRTLAQLYASKFEQFRKTERSVREDINELLELKQWSQTQIVEFTELQRKLLYLSIGKQFATGQTNASELPGYAATIRERITDIEIELGCDFPTDSSG